MIVIYGYLERESDKVLMPSLKPLRLINSGVRGAYQRKYGVYNYLKIKVRKCFLRLFDFTCMNQKCHVTVTLTFITQFVYRNLFPVKVCQ